MIFIELFLTFFKIGITTFGGGYAMIPLIQSEIVAKGWLTETALVNFIAVSESTPGPFAINIATYVGRVTAGMGGSLCATLGVVLPSFIIILIVAKFYKKFKASKTVKGVMTGLRPAVIGLIGAALVSMATTVFFPLGVSLTALLTWDTVASVVILALALYLGMAKKLSPIIIILISAALGIASGYIQMIFV